MRSLTSGVAAGLFLAAAAAAAASAGTPNPDVTAPIRTFVDSFNRGDAAAAAATHAATADLAILDEVSPYLWRGPQAFQAWSAALESHAKERGITDQVVAIGAPTREEVDGGKAHVVVPATYTYKERGVAMREDAQMTFALKKRDGGWLIHAWAWTGPRPHAVEPAKP